MISYLTQSYPTDDIHTGETAGSFSPSSGFALASVGMSVLGSLGALNQGQNEKNIANRNAATATRNAAQARYSGRENAALLRLQSEFVTGRMKATAGTTGIYVNSGSNADAITATHDQYELDAMKALYEGELQASAFERQADIYRYSGKVAQKQSYFQAGFGLASGLTNVFNAMQYGSIPSAMPLPPTSVLGSPPR